MLWWVADYIYFRNDDYEFIAAAAPEYDGGVAEDEPEAAPAPAESDSSSDSTPAVRSDFPETWIWLDSEIRYYGR